MSQYGFVYVLYSPAMPGVYKIGSTTRSPNQRAEELSKGTGVPHAYEVAYYAEFRCPSEQERRVHAALSENRVSMDREFFKVRLIEAIEAIEDVSEHLSSWCSDLAMEAKQPGRVFPENPLYFEKGLHDLGFIERVRREAQQ